MFRALFRAAKISEGTRVQTQTILSIASGAAGLIGSLILAYSLNPALLTLRQHAQSTEETAHSLVAGGNVLVVRGFDKQHAQSFASATRRMRWGCGLLMLGFLVQIANAVLLQSVPTTASFGDTRTNQPSPARR